MDIDSFLNCVRTGTIPPTPPPAAWLDSNSLAYIDMREKIGWCDKDPRRECNRHGMWAIVTVKFAKDLAGWIGNRKVLEIMAGRGWLAKALQEQGVDVLPTDNNSWNDRHDACHDLVPIVRLGALAAVRHLSSDRDILLVSWPPYDKTAISYACSAWGPERPIIYIGEGDGGCNAASSFWRHFHTVGDHSDIPFAQWWAMHDDVHIGHYV